MAIKELKKAVKTTPFNYEKDVEKFIAKGGSLAGNSVESMDSDQDHRLTMRIPKWLMNKVDEKRKERVGKISRNLWILEIIDKATKK